MSLGKAIAGADSLSDSTMNFRASPRGNSTARLVRDPLASVLPFAPERLLFISPRSFAILQRQVDLGLLMSTLRTTRDATSSIKCCRVCCTIAIFQACLSLSV